MKHTFTIVFKCVDKNQYIDIILHVLAAEIHSKYCDNALSKIKTSHIKISKRISPHGHLTPVVGQVAHDRHDTCFALCAQVKEC